MNKKIVRWGAMFALLAVMIGAFSTHTLKNIFTLEQMYSFEIAIKYQMYHAIILLIIGFHADRLKKIYWMSFFFIAGIILFSFSIYLLCIQDIIGQSFSFLGPITPIGGILLISAWITLLLSLINKEKIK